MVTKISIVVSLVWCLFSFFYIGDVLKIRKHFREKKYNVIGDEIFENIINEYNKFLKDENNEFVVERLLGQKIVFEYHFVISSEKYSKMISISKRIEDRFYNENIVAFINLDLDTSDFDKYISAKIKEYPHKVTIPTNV